MMRQITSGDYDVTAYYGYDNVQGAHYFQSTINGAINRTVSRLDAKGKLTTIGEAEGSSSAIFSPRHGLLYDVLQQHNDSSRLHAQQL